MPIYWNLICLSSVMCASSLLRFSNRGYSHCCTSTSSTRPILNLCIFWYLSGYRAAWMSPTWRGRRPNSIRGSVSEMPWRHCGTWPCRTIDAVVPGDVECCRQESQRAAVDRHALRCCWCPAQCPVRAIRTQMDRPTGQRRTLRPDLSCASPSRATSHSDRLR